MVLSPPRSPPGRGGGAAKPLPSGKGSGRVVFRQRGTGRASSPLHAYSTTSPPRLTWEAGGGIDAMGAAARAAPVGVQASQARPVKDAAGLIAQAAAHRTCQRLFAGVAFESIHHSRQGVQTVALRAAHRVGSMLGLRDGPRGQGVAQHPLVERVLREEDWRQHSVPVRERSTRSAATRKEDGPAGHRPGVAPLSQQPPEAQPLDGRIPAACTSGSKRPTVRQRGRHLDDDDTSNS